MSLQKRRPLESAHAILMVFEGLSCQREAEAVIEGLWKVSLEEDQVRSDINQIWFFFRSVGRVRSDTKVHMNLVLSQRHVILTFKSRLSPGFPWW